MGKIDQSNQTSSIEIHMYLLNRHIISSHFLLSVMSLINCVERGRGFDPYGPAPEGVTLMTPEGVILITPEGIILMAPEGVILITPEGVILMTPEGVILSHHLSFIS